MQIPHHDAHAASAFYPSGFEQALVLVADGMGERESLTLYTAADKQLTKLASIPDIYSLGLFYSLFTVYLGFNFNADEYKVMGLAPYGDPLLYFQPIMDLIELKDKGMYESCWLAKASLDAVSYETVLTDLVQRFGDKRQPNMPITQRHKDIAAALQRVLETVLLHVLTYYKQQTGMSQLCMAGGVALNCVANQKIAESGLFKRQYLQPAAGDDGTALGAALYAHQQCAKSDQKILCSAMPYYGCEYTNEQILAALDQANGYHWQCFGDTLPLCQFVADKLSCGNIIGWFQGRMEYGPRALGNRSILADPRDSDMQQRLNRLIKQREDFRPFAPAVTIEAATHYFMLDENKLGEYKTMQQTAQVKSTYQAQLPAVTHVDGSARVQVVSAGDNHLFHTLLKTFGEQTDLPVLVNTSLNVNQQPIARAPEDALLTLERARFDYLVMGQYVVSKNV